MAGQSIDRDPARRRETAALASAAAVLLGWALPASRAGRGMVSGLAVATAVGGTVLALAARRQPEVQVHVELAATDDVGLIDVLIPARDEAHVIGGVIGDLARQEPRGGFRVVVVDDRSIDGTGDAAIAAIEAAGLAGEARVIRRTDGSDGKAAALAFAEAAVDQPIAVLVLDADARVDPSFVARCRRAIAAGSPTATARRRVLRGRETGGLGRWLVEAQAAEQAADDVVQRGRLGLGGAGELRGNGMLIRADVLAELGGWPADALTEDLDLSTRIYLRTGRGAARPPGLEVWEQAAMTPGSMLTQRLRWAEGSVRRDLTTVLPALGHVATPPRRRIDVAVSAAQDLAPWLAFGLLVRATRSGNPRPAAELALGYGVAAAVIALAAEEPAIPAPRRVGGVLALGASWAAILPIAWLRVAWRPDRPAFRPTIHLPAAAVRPPPFASGESRRPGPPSDGGMPGSPAATSRRGGDGGGR